MIRILPLYEVPQCSEAVTDWLYQAFGSTNSRAFFASIVASSLRPEGLPITFVALDGERLVGTVGVWRCDLISRQDLWPWLAALYIDESQRGKGLGERLQQHAVAYARQAGFDHLYLYALFEGYYERFGWDYIGDGLEYPDQPVRLYHKSL